MDGKEQRRKRRDPFIFRKKKTNPCNAQSIEYVKDQIRQVIEERIQSADQMIDLIAEERERDIQLRIVRCERLIDRSERKFLHNGIFEDQKPVIPAHESVVK